MQTAKTPAVARTMVDALARHLNARLVETHLSWVLLGRERAWKIKKPVRLGFVDYGTLDRRRHFCEEELRLNRRLAPSLYLAVAQVTGTAEAPELNGGGEVQEYAVEMLRFADGVLFAELLEAGTLLPEDVDSLAELIAGLHGRSPPAPPANGFGRIEHRRRTALAALDGARACATDSEYAAMRAWLEASADALGPFWDARRDSGAIREGHGDLHLDNVVRLDSGVEAFDCIEFDPGLRWIDVLDDIAFAVMDFSARGRQDFAFRLLNLWLDLTGDHDALPSLRFAVVYRALVRAQVEHLRHPGQPGPGRRYFATALAWTRPVQPRLFITHGLPASGKTVASQRLLQRERAIRLRSDVERKRLFGLGMLESSRDKGLDLYGAKASARTYERLFAMARSLLRCGYPVILDAAFLKREERGQALALALEQDAPFSIVHCDAPEPVLRERLLARRGDASEADGAVLDLLRGVAEPLTCEEQAFLWRDC